MQEIRPLRSTCTFIVYGRKISPKHFPHFGGAVAWALETSARVPDCLIIVSGSRGPIVKLKGGEPVHPVYKALVDDVMSCR